MKCDWFPLGLGYVASSLHSRGFCVGIYNAEFHAKPEYLRYAKMLDRSEKYCNGLEDGDHPIWVEVKDVIESFGPDVVGLTIKTPKLKSAQRIARICKSIDKGIVVVVGGPHPTVLPEEVLSDENMDYAVRGEGEVTMLELLEALQGKRPLDSVDGMSYRRQTRIFHNRNRSVMCSLDENPLPSKESLINAGAFDREVFGDIITSRGCPFNCAYCAAHLTWTRNVRYRTIPSILEEIRTVIDTYGTRQFTFWDDSFTLNKKRTLEFCETLQTKKMRINWACNTRFDLLDEEIIVHLKEAGCNNIELGVESGSPRVLKLIRKGTPIEKMKHVASILRKHNLYWSGFFMIGLPTETSEDIRMTINLMETLKPNYATFSVFTPYPGTELHQMLLEKGIMDATAQWHLYNHQSRNNNFTGIVDNEEFRSLVDETSRAFDANNNRLSNLCRRAMTKAAVYSSHPTELLKDAKRYLNYIGVLQNSQNKPDALRLEGRQPMNLACTQSFRKGKGKPMKRALITGITGQDGSYLAELLLEEGYEVHGIVRRVAIEDPEHRLWRIRHILDRVILHAASLESYPSIFNVVESIKPDECYHLAAQSFVSYSFEDEFSTINTNIDGTHYVLSSVRKKAPGCRFYFAASSEMFGNATETPQNEDTPLHPRSAYGISKVAGYHLTENYRSTYNLHASNGILFNHESPRRGFEFVTRKITSHAAKIKLGLQNKIKLGNLEARRDWGHAREYVKAMWLMLQQDEPGDYVVATGQTHSVREFLEVAFDYVGLNPYEYLEEDQTLYRPSEVFILQGDASRAKRILEWENNCDFESLVEDMVKADLNLLSRHSMSAGIPANVLVEVGSRA